METQWIDYLSKVTVYISVSYLFYYYLLSNDAHFLLNRLFLLSMLPLSFLLPLAPLQSPFRRLTLSPEALQAFSELKDPVNPTSALSLTLFIGYWIVFTLLCLRILFHLIHLYRLQNRQPRERLHNITLVKINTPIPPFSFFNRIFLHSGEQCGHEELEQIISHESVHIRQFHSLDILIMELAVALQWFNPLIWLYKKALKETHEYLADREVIAQGFNADGYRLLLFEQQFGAKLFEFASNLKQSQIKRRMFMMNRMNETGKVPYRIILALPLIVLLALALAEPKLVLAQTAATDSRSAAQDQTQKQEVMDTLKKFAAKQKMLEEKLAAAGSDEERLKIKQALHDLISEQKAYEVGVGIKTDEKISEEKAKELMAKFAEKEKYLKELYSKADSPEKKEKIKQDLESLFKKRQEFLQQAGMRPKEESLSREDLEKKLLKVQEKRAKLKQMIADEKNQEKLQELKSKYKEVAEFEEQLKIKIQAQAKQNP